MQKAFQNQSVDIQARGFIEDTAATLIVALGNIVVFIGYALSPPKTELPAWAHYEPKVLSQISAAASASIIAIGIDNEPPFITITQSLPAKPSSTSGQEPAVVSEQNGDIKITMSQDLANSLQDIIIRESTCLIEHTGRRRRTPDFNCLSGAGINVIINAQPQMRLANLVLMAATRAPSFRHLAAESARALATTVQFARDSAPTLQVPTNVAEQFGAVVFALVYDAIALGTNMAPEVILDAARWTLDEPVSSACSITTIATVGEIACTMLGAMVVCQSDYDEKTGCSVEDVITTTWAPLPSYTQPPVTTARQQPPACFNYADPHAAVRYCQCNDGKNYVLPSGGVCASYIGIPPSQSLVPTPTQPPSAPAKPPPAAKSLILVFWYLPPVTGPVTYRLFEVPADSKRDFNQECDHQVADGQFGYYNDPNQGRVDDLRSKGTEPQRQAPGILPPGVDDKMISHGVPAIYKENTLGMASINWPNILKHVDCQPPTTDLQHTFTSRMGSTCGDNAIPHVMNLVMVCPVNF